MEKLEEMDDFSFKFSRARRKEKARTLSFKGNVKLIPYLTKTAQERELNAT